MADKVGVFSKELFLKDVELACKVMNAPYSEDMTAKVLKAYEPSFREGAVIWHITDQPGSALKYRFYERRNIDAIALAVDGGLLKSDHPLIPLLRHWSEPWDKGTPMQYCDFDAEKGLSKIWVYMGYPRPLADLLHMHGTSPQYICKHEPRFRTWGLKIVTFVSFDFHSETINIYFRLPNPLSETYATQYLSMAGCPPISQQEFAEITSFQKSTGLTLAVTIHVGTGEIQRMTFYTRRIPPESLPRVNDKLQIFFQEAPSHDTEEFNAIGWSFEKGGKKYVKAEKGYCGKVVPLLEGWNTILTSN